MRVCTKCNEAKDYSEFYVLKNRGGKLDTWCKSCHVAKKLRQRYALTPDQYDAMLVSQGGVCAICKSEPSGKRLSVDHDHSCCPGEHTCGNCIRGLLCDNCNWWLGVIDDRLEMLVSAETYLRRYGCTVSDAVETSIQTRQPLRAPSLTSRVYSAVGASPRMQRLMRSQRGSLKRSTLRDTMDV
jgi:Recombination endonuclease VII